MNLPRFVSVGEVEWGRLDELIRKAQGRPERLGAAGVRELGTRYRAVVADLARARSSFPGDPITRRLEYLALQGRQLVYDNEITRPSLRRFMGTTYWQLVRSRPKFLFAALGFLLVPALLAAAWAVIDPGAATGLVPGEFRNVLDPGEQGTDMGLTLAEEVGFSTLLAQHNVLISFMAFAFGMFWCIGTVYVLIHNGLFFGAIGGLLFQSGNGAFFLELTAAHGLLELSGTVVAAAAGLRMGWALVDPDKRPRREVLVEEARNAVLIVLGSIPMFLVAALIEGFISRRGLSAPPVAIVGVLLAGGYWLTVWRRGGASRDAQMRESALTSR